jgi:hypothetical protein
MCVSLAARIIRVPKAKCNVPADRPLPPRAGQRAASSFHEKKSSAERSWKISHFSPSCCFAFVLKKMIDFKGENGSLFYVQTNHHHIFLYFIFH